MAEEEGELLTILLDTHLFYGPATTQPQVAGATNRQLSADQLLQQLLVYINSFLTLHERNKLVVFAVHHNSSPILYCSNLTSSNAKDAVSPGQQLLQELLKVLASTGQVDQVPAGIALSGALSRALCFILRYQREAAGARSLSHPRILVLTAAPDVPAQYVPIMNAIFSAQRSDIVIDACMLGEGNSSFLQQAAHLTGGLYLRPPSRHVLLQYLLTMFSADTYTRSMLNIPQSAGVDFRASCFCHKTQVDIGYVCSVCLSIFCGPSSQCSTCGASFPGRKQRDSANGGAARTPAAEADT